MVFLRGKMFFIAFLLIFGLISVWFGAASPAGAESNPGAGLFPDWNFVKRFCDVPDEARATVSSDKLFIKPDDDFNLNFSVGNIKNVYDYRINLPLASFVAPANSPPWTEGDLFEGKSFLITDNSFNGNSVVFASRLSGSDCLVTVGPDSTKTLGSICLQAGSQDGDFNIFLPDEAVLFFDAPGGNRIAYRADPFNVVIDGTAPVIGLDPGIPDSVNANPDGIGSVTVSGAVYEENLDCILVNGAPAEFAADGGVASFSSEVVLQAGINTIEVQAADKSGNSAGITKQVTLVPPPIIEGRTGTVRGKVTKGGDTPFQNAEVILLQESQFIQEDITDQDGMFVINEVIPGNYDLVAFYPGFLKVTTSIYVGSGDNLYSEMELVQTDSSDLDGNGIVDEQDLQIFMNFYWRMKQQGLRNSNFDFNKDGKVDILDLSALGKSFGYSFTAM